MYTFEGLHPADHVRHSGAFLMAFLPLLAKFLLRLRQFGKVEIPQEAFIEALKIGD
ncbi:MAG TPA: hypothetical protein VMX97_05645 [Hyphomicrobiaceae bacterium]|nr:hypothetical protein [Hyphomicrobiaceae bacterium]